MLWEQGDPYDALRRRFGFADLGAAGAWLRSTTAAAWGLEVGAPTRLVMSDHNALAWVPSEAGDLVVKWSVDPTRFQRLDEVAALVAALGAGDLSVSAPLPCLDGRLQVRLGGASVSLQRVVAGDLLDTDDPAQVHRAGAVLARLHLALADQTAPPGWHADARVLSTGRVRRWLAAERPHLPPGAAQALHARLGELPDEPLGTQPLHGDYRAANVLCAGGEVVAVIDFEEAHLGSRLEECARAGVLLGTRFHDWGPVAPEVRRTFLTGYASVRPLAPAEHAWWDALELWHALAMVPAEADPTGWGAAAHEQVARLARG